MQTKLPLDVQINVIEWVYRSSQHRDIDYLTLRACALVCKAWIPTAQRLLFRRVSIPRLDFQTPDTLGITCLLRALRAAPHLAAHVRTFFKLLSRYHDAESEEEELAALALCANVQGLVFIGGFLNTSIFRLPHSKLITRLGAVRIRPNYICLSGNGELINRVLQIWPSVCALEVTMLARTESVDRSVQMPRTLQMLSTRASDMPLYWPAPGAVPPALHDLEIEFSAAGDMSHWTNAAVIASGVFAQLRTLRIVGLFAEVPPAAVFEQLAVLETLVIESFTTKESFMLPCTLRHFGYHSSSDLEQHWKVQILLDAVRQRPELRLLTATRCSSQAMLKQLEGVCREGGVEFVVYAEPACFPSSRSSDWI